MIISHKHRFQFIHNPKVGGTSIRTILNPFHDGTPEPLWHQGWDSQEHRVVDLAHLTADKTHTIPALFTFGFVRDPYTRFWSSLNEFMRRHSDSFPSLTPSLLCTILTPASIRYDWRFVHFCPQNAFFYEGNRCVADFIGRHENMSRDWESVTALCGNLWSKDLGEERKTPEDRFPAEWRTDLRFLRLINRLYMRDFMLFGYTMKGELGMQDTHADRIEVVHNPALVPWFCGQEEGAMTFRAGERAALIKARTGKHPGYGGNPTSACDEAAKRDVA